MEIQEAIANRRSIRKYKSDAVDDKLVKAVLEAARQAPSWGNSQCWRFVVVRDPARKERLANTLIGITDRPNRVAEAMKVAPVAIAVCAEPGQSGFTYREPKEPATDKGEWWYMFDAALAIQNLVLAAHAVGLGAVIVGAFDAKKAAEVLEVPSSLVVVALTPLGYPDEAPNARPRKELSEIVHYDRFAVK
jgi:nitroreductase